MPAPVNPGVSMHGQGSGVRHLTVDERGAGQRIDNFLLRELKGVPRSLIYRLLRRGEVRVNRGRVRADRRLAVGDVVRIPPLRLAERPPRSAPPPRAVAAIEKDILHEDRRILVLDKPAGVAVHGGSGISFGVIELLRAARPAEKGLELAHRLDRDTSGCLLVARRRSALRAFQALQQQGRVEKRYLALVAGRWARDRVEVKAPLEKNLLRSGERVVRVSPRGKAAHTSFRVVRRFADATLVEARLHTGRTHQIRVHAAHLGTPLLGDEKYGDAAANRVFRGRGLKRLFLHAARLAFTWPEGELQRFEAPLPLELQQVLDELK